MPNAKILFVIPESAGDLAALVDEMGGECEDSLDDVGGYLSANPGQMTSVVFSDCENPIICVTDVTDELKKHGAPYFAVTDSFTERSRGIRFQATVTLNLSGSRSDEKSKKFPWENGEPDVNEESLEAAGFDAEDIKAMTAKFFPDSPPSPRFRS